MGNEPNLNRYWLPQFGPNGEDVAATSYVQLLARTYDAMKAADRGVFIIGGSVAPRGIDRPGTGRDTHSPTAFITDMGTAYRALNRTRPIMDGFSFHPYGENSSTPPTFAHASGTSLGLADYDKLVALLGKAFDGTAQIGSTAADRLRRVRRGLPDPDRQAPLLRRARAGDDQARQRGRAGCVLPRSARARRLPAHRARLPDLPCHRRDRLQPLAVRRVLRGRHAEVVAPVRQAGDGRDPVRGRRLRRAARRAARREAGRSPQPPRSPRRKGSTRPCRWLGPRGRLRASISSMEGQYVAYSFFRVDPAWRRLPIEERAAGKDAFAEVVEDWAGRMDALRAYTVTGVRPDSDFFLWKITQRYEDLGELGAALNGTPLAGWLRDALLVSRDDQGLRVHEGQARTQGRAEGLSVSRRLPVREGPALVRALARGPPARDGGAHARRRASSRRSTTTPRTRSGSTTRSS